VLGHATAAMTMDLYGHLVDDNLWEAARAVGGILGASEPPESRDAGRGRNWTGRKCLVLRGFRVEPPWGIEPQTYALREARQWATHALAAPIARAIALTALAALGLSTDPFHGPFHACDLASRRPVLCA
jgi:hypothetical protein